MFSPLPQSDVEIILLHWFPRVLQRTREKENQNSNTPRNISVPSLFCSHSLPPFICSFSGWEVSLCRLPTYYSSRQNKQTKTNQNPLHPSSCSKTRSVHRKASTSRHSQHSPVTQGYTCPHCSAVRLLCVWAVLRGKEGRSHADLPWVRYSRNLVGYMDYKPQHYHKLPCNGKGKGWDKRERL